MKKPWLLWLLSACLGACQSTATLPLTDPYYEIPVGSHLALLKPLDIPAASATVRLQFGKIVSRFHTQDFEPVCVFESNLVGDAAQRVEPDSFEIIRVRRDYNTTSAQTENGLIKVRGGTGVSFGSDGGSRLYYKTELFLRSAKQPQILAMTCQHAWETGSSGLDLRPLTVAEMRQAMGEYFALHLPDGK